MYAVGLNTFLLYILASAHDSQQVAANLNVPGRVDKDDATILKSQYTFFRMFRDNVAKNRCMMPVKFLNTAAQTMYSKTKGGVDKGTDNLSMVHNPVKNMRFERKFVLRSVFQVFVNAGIAYRHYQRKELLKEAEPTNTSFQEIRKSLTLVESIRDFFVGSGCGASFPERFPP